jgi:TRAP-type C4-dicarboxylate transport system permease large subunit
MWDYTREVWPFLLAMVVVLILLSAFPQISLFLPELIYG